MEDAFEARWVAANIDRPKLNIAPVSFQFDAVTDCFPKALVMQLAEVDDATYNYACASGGVSFSYKFRTSFDPGIRAHNFFDIVNLVFWLSVKNALNLHAHRRVYAEVLTDLFASYFDAAVSSAKYWGELEELCAEFAVVGISRTEQPAKGRINLELATRIAIQRLSLIVDRTNKLCSQGPCCRDH